MNTGGVTPIGGEPPQNELGPEGSFDSTAYFSMAPSLKIEEYDTAVEGVANDDTVKKVEQIIKHPGTLKVEAKIGVFLGGLVGVVIAAAVILVLENQLGINMNFLGKKEGFNFDTLAKVGYAAVFGAIGGAVGHKYSSKLEEFIKQVIHQLQIPLEEGGYGIAFGDDSVYNGL